MKLSRSIQAGKHKQNSHSAREELFAIRERNSQEIRQQRKSDIDKDNEFNNLKLKIETQFGIIGMNQSDLLGTFGT